MIQGKHIIEPTNTIKLSDRTEYTFEIDIESRLSDVFDLLPSNSVINKGRCGIGGTYLEINANRNSIIIVPTNGIINNKCFNNEGRLFKNFFVVRGSRYEFDVNGLKEFLANDVSNKKIFCTPESFDKIVYCGFPLDELHKDWFVLFDESHTTITDDFRNRILDAYEFVFKFDNIAFISATPYDFTCPELNRFNRYHITFKDKVGELKVFVTTQIQNAIYTILKNPQRFEGRVHIFLNEVNEIANSIRRAKLTDCSIFCKDDRKNARQLDELVGYWKDEPCERHFSKYNFYTSKYFEGWDLYDEGATIIVVSDIHKPTLKTGISNKCAQAAGRNRKPSAQIIHLTNQRQLNDFNDLTEIYRQVKATANSAISNYNNHVQECHYNDTSTDNDFTNGVDKYGIFKNGSKLATLNDFKIDRIVNRRFCDQEYNNTDYIKEAWKRVYYDVTVTDITVAELPKNISRLRGRRQIELVTKYLEHLTRETSNNIIHYLDMRYFLPTEFEYIRKYHKVLGASRLRELNYDPKFVRQEYIVANNKKLMQDVKQAYFNKMGHDSYHKNELLPILQDLYFMLGILDHRKAKDVVKVAKVTDLKRLYTKFTNTKKDGAIAYKITTF